MSILGLRMEKDPRTRPWAACLVILSFMALAGCASTPASAPGGLPPVVRRFLDRADWNLAAEEDSDLADLGRYRRLDRRYIVAAPVEEVWRLYASVDPRLAWRTPMTRFGAAWDGEAGRLVLEGDEGLAAFRVGQVYVLELTIAGFYRIPVGFRITVIDEPGRVMEFVYLRDNKSNGKQLIALAPCVDGRGRPATVVEHRTWYSSGDGFRDDLLYPPFHYDIIDGFHRSIAALAGYGIVALED